MNIKQYNKLKNNLPDNIYGQFFTIDYYSQSGLTAENKKKGYFKVGEINGHINKYGYIEQVSKKVDTNVLTIDVQPLRDSFYNAEYLNGFFSCLKSNNDRKYLKFVYDTDSKNNIYCSYVSPDNTLIHNPREFLTGSAIKNLDKELTGRLSELYQVGININQRTFAIENIIRLKISGIEIIDKNLAKYLQIIQNIKKG